MIVAALILIAVTLALLHNYHQQTRRWRIFQQRGIPYAEPSWPLGSAHMWRVVFSSDTTFTEMFRTYLGTNLEKGKTEKKSWLRYSKLIKLVADIIYHEQLKSNSRNIQH